ncbi:MAG: ABC transporter substrate-binding protein [Deltaproteobacteria bacterium]|nr:ABC transporter substrate-binding protein [Deltaproteobacteria bacterium]
MSRQTATRALLAIGLLGLPLGEGLRPAWGQRLERITIGVPTKNFLYWPLYMAQSRGLFEREGLHADIVVMRSNLMIAALMAGELAYTGSAASAMMATAQGLPIRTVFVLAVRPTLSVIVSPQVQGGRDLRGRSIAISAKGSITDAVARETARHYGLDPDRDIRTVGLGAQSERLAALASGAVAGAVLDPPVDLIALKQGFRRLIWAGEILEAPQAGLATSDRKIREQPQQVLRTVRALLQGLRFVRTQREEAVRSLMADFKVDRATAETSYDLVIRAMSEDGSVGVQALRKAIELARAQRPVPETMEPAHLVDFRFLREAAAKLTP